jgi:hypothetical protein
MKASRNISAAPTVGSTIGHGRDDRLDGVLGLEIVAVVTGLVGAGHVSSSFSGVSSSPGLR